MIKKILAIIPVMVVLLAIIGFVILLIIDNPSRTVFAILCIAGVVGFILWFLWAVKYWIEKERHDVIAILQESDDSSERWIYGTRVFTLKNDGSTDWEEGARDNCMWGVKGEIADYSDAHGLCYKVKHTIAEHSDTPGLCYKTKPVKVFAWYNRCELKKLKSYFQKF